MSEFVFPKQICNTIDPTNICSYANWKGEWLWRHTTKLYTLMTYMRYCEDCDPKSFEKGEELLVINSTLKLKRYISNPGHINSSYVKERNLICKDTIYNNYEITNGLGGEMILNPEKVRSPLALSPILLLGFM